MIQVNQLSKQFDQFKAVDDVSFSVRKGEVLGFLGPNGAGKSTTMKMITGFLAPSSGEISVCGHNVFRDPIKIKQSIGYLPEGAPAYPDMTPRQFLKFIAEIRGFRGIEKIQRVETAARRLNLQSVMDRPIENLSKGFKRRVGLAQAILHDPQILIMDEPTDGLDPNQKHEVRQLIREMARDKAIIVSTHILEEVKAVCTRAIIISQGKLLFDGTPEELEKRSRYFQAITVSVNQAPVDEVVSTLAALPCTESVEKLEADNNLTRILVFPKNGVQITKEVHECLSQNNWEVDEFHIEAGRLDDVFRDITIGSDLSSAGALT